MSKHVEIGIGYAKDHTLTDSGELVSRLKKLGNVNENRHIIDGMRRAGGLLRDSIRWAIYDVHEMTKNDYPMNPYTLWDSVTNTYKRGKEGELRIVGYKRTSPYHGALAHLLDRGTADRYTKAGDYTGRVTPRRFVDKALRRSERAIASRISAGLRRAIEEAEGKL